MNTQKEHQDESSTSSFEEERYKKGLQTLIKVNGAEGEAVLSALENISPDFADILVKVGYGDIYSRAGLTLKQREICAITAIAALGNAPAPLKAHIRNALNAGCTREEIIEVLIQISLYSGFLNTISALFTANEVFIEMGITCPEK